MARAAAAGDAAAALPLLDAEATWTGASGVTRARADFESALPRPGISDEQAAQVRRFDYGRVGVVRVDAGRLHALRVWVERPEGWRLLIYQEVESLPAPPTVTPGIGEPCVNPCETIPYRPRTAAEQGVIDAYHALETAAHGGDAETFARYVADEFVVISSHSDRPIDKAGRMEGLRKAAYGGVAPGAFVTGQMFEFGDVVVMRSQHHTATGARLQITRVWVNRGGTWMSTLSYQTVAPTIAIVRQ